MSATTAQPTRKDGEMVIDGKFGTLKALPDGVHPDRRLIYWPHPDVKIDVMLLIVHDHAGRIGRDIDVPVARQPHYFYRVSPGSDLSIVEREYADYAHGGS